MSLSNKYTNTHPTYILSIVNHKVIKYLKLINSNFIIFVFRGIDNDDDIDAAFVALCSNILSIGTHIIKK